MTPDPGLDDILRRQKRRARKRRRKRAGFAAVLAVLAVLVVLVVRRARERLHVQLGLQPLVAPAGRDRPELVRLRGGQLAARRDPGRAEPPARPAERGQPVGGEGDRRDRGPPLLEPRRRRPAGDRARALGRRPLRARSCRAARRSRSSSSATSTSRSEQTFSRKLKEVCLAIKLSHAWSKQRILAAYMNQVYYGNHAYGIEAAAQTYFSKRREQAHARPGRAPRRAAAGAVRVRPVHRAPEGARAPRRGAAGAARRTATSPRRSTPRRSPTAASISSRAGSTRGSASRTSSATCATS